MAEIQKYSFNYEDYGRFRDIGKSDSDFKTARKAKLQGLTIQDAPQGYGLVFPALAQGQAAPEGTTYIITFTGTNNNDINIDTEVIKTIVQALKDVQPANPFKEKLKKLIGDLNEPAKTISEKITPTTPVEDVKAIILEAYVHQNVIKILTIVYAYFVLIEITSGKSPDDQPTPGPQPKPTPPKIQDDIINPQDVTLTAFFGNLFDPFDGKAEYVAELEELAETDYANSILAKILNGKPIILPDIKVDEHPVYEHLRKSKVETYNANDPKTPIIKDGGYNAAIQNNIESLKGALADQEKEERSRALAGLLRRMQYFRAKKGFGPGGPSAAANNDLLKFVLDTFPLFTKMSTDDVDLVGTGSTGSTKQQGGKNQKKNKKHH